MTATITPMRILTIDIWPNGAIHTDPLTLLALLFIIGATAWTVRRAWPVLLLALSIHAAPLPILGPYAASTNHSDDIQGTADGRPNTWGNAGYSVHTYNFHPPTGYSTRILRVYGNVQGFLRKPPAAGTCSGVLWGLQSTAPDGSARMSPAADNTFLYIQDATCGAPWRDAVDFDTHINGLLIDNVMYSKVAVFLNETGGAIHIEPQWTTVYQFEPTPAQPVAPLTPKPKTAEFVGQAPATYASKLTWNSRGREVSMNKDGEMDLPEGISRKIALASLMCWMSHQYDRCEPNKPCSSIDCN